MASLATMPSTTHSAKKRLELLLAEDWKMTRNGMLHVAMLVPLMVGISLIGYGLGSDYLYTSDIDSLGATLAGFVICIVAGAAMAILSPPESTISSEMP